VNQKLSSGLKRLEWEKSLTVFYSPITLEEVEPRTMEPKSRFTVTTSGVDHAGIVFRVCRFLTDRKVNVTDMKTHQVFSAESGTPLFEMEIDIEVPNSIPEQGLREDLHRLANELRIDLVLRKM
jgi:glycine cleavage system transcriptional repressor